MSHTSDFIDLMAGLDDAARGELLTRHVQLHGEVSMTESLRQLVEHAEALDTDPASAAWQGLPEGLVQVFVEGNEAHREFAIGVWNVWVDVVTAAREAGTVGAGIESSVTPVSRPADRPPVASPVPSRCPSCGVPADGLCANCAAQQLLHDHDLDHDRRLYEDEHEVPARDRLRDDPHDRPSDGR